MARAGWATRPPGQVVTSGPGGERGQVMMPAWHHRWVSATRLVTLGDVPALTELVRANRDFLAPWEPARNESYFTAAGQRAVVRDALARHGQGSVLPHVILDESGRVAGRITLND